MDRRNLVLGVPLLALSTAVFPRAAAALAVPARVHDRKEDYHQAKYGIFVHLVAELTVKADGTPCNDVDNLAEHFDVERFAEAIASFNPDYLAFTAWHFRCRPLYPSKVNRRWRHGTSCARRDLVGEIIRAMKARSIPVLLYTHPRDGHDFDEQDMIATGWGAGGREFSPDPNPATFNFAQWNKYAGELYAELMERYGSEVLGIYVDEGSGRGDSERVVDYQRLRQIIKGPHNGNSPVMLQNFFGSTYTADFGNREYCHSDEFAETSGDTWPAYEKMGVSACVGSVWYATKAADAWTTGYSPEALFRYTVIQASLNQSGGGIAWSAGPYCDGRSWETGVQPLLQSVGHHVQARRSAIHGTVPSLAYPTRPSATFRSLEWGVATESPDHREVFLHVLKPPPGRSLRLPLPANGLRVRTASELRSSADIQVQTDDKEVAVSLGEGMVWDQLDTVIRVRMY